jgi:MFS family permease
MESKYSEGLPDSAKGQAITTLVIATLIYTLNAADRYVYSALLVPIKAEFQLSDAGAASVNLGMGLMLMFFGIPAGMLADRMSRKLLLAGSITIFSAMTALGGVTSSLAGFVATRLGVGFGEAGCTPSALSLLSDRFKPNRRSVAMTIYTLGICAGSALGTGVAAALSDAFGWRAAMLVFGLIGLPLGVITVLFVKEPARGSNDTEAQKTATSTDSLMDALVHIWRDKQLFFVMIGGATISTWGWGMLFWTPTFYVRTYNFSVAEGGALLGTVHLVGGTAATFLIAYVMHRLSHRDFRFQIWTVASMITLAAAVSIAAYATTDQGLSIICLWIFAPVLYMYSGPTYGLINNLSPPHLRAKVVAIFLFLTTLGNLVFAPTIIGYISDIFASFGADETKSLRYSLVLFAPLGLVAGMLYALAGFRSASKLDEVPQASSTL